MKMNIKWHRECLVNRFSRVEDRKKELKKLQERVEELDKKNTLYFLQIQTAEKRGLTAFDRERFLLTQK